jgi:Flp pilus assembly protein TadD
LAVAYEQTGRLGDARHAIERVAALEPGNKAHLLELARLADAGKDYEGALGYLAHARDLAPEDAQVHFLFAMIAMKLELPVEARASLQRALELHPENPAYNYAMGFVILNTRDAATAAQYFKKFVEAKPRDPQGHYALGIAYFASGDNANSKKEILTAKDNPKTAGGAEYFLGRIARREDNLEDAMLHLRKSIELLPEYPESHTELARIWILKGKLAEAQAELDRALHLDAKSFQANEQLLVLYRRTHNERAAQQAEVVKKLDEDRSRRAELMLRTIEVRP